MITTTEHLQLIKDECERLIPEYSTSRSGYLSAQQAVAGWRATIAAIEALESMAAIPMDILILQLTKDILAAWPIELLTNKPQ